MQVVILCGGKGTRLREETEFRPKPLVEIGGKPILWHIMKTYSYFGFKDFVLCLGYKGYMVKEYFLNYKTMNNDFTVKLGNHEDIQFHNNCGETDWTVTLVDTGEESQTGSRIKKIEKYIKGDSFMVTYGDGVANIDINKLLEFHKAEEKIGTVTGVRPSSRFGELVVEKNKVIKFHEKPQVNNGLINGGFFVFNKSFFKYLKEDAACSLESEPLEALVAKGELGVYVHDGFWQCVDTYRELELLNKMWEVPKPLWKIW
ncbi:MAG: glucose-1-phosphate cytidylyltransferase [Candidatus Omnitrophota bacterium]|jgi:glucose-1-phosphate cytidylyltransferase